MRLFERRRRSERRQKEKEEARTQIKQEAYEDLVESLGNITCEEVELRLYVGSKEGKKLASVLLPLVEAMGFPLVLKKHSRVKDRHLVVVYKNHLKFRTIRF